MPNDMMFECEQKREFRRSGGDVWEWRTISDSEHCRGGIHYDGNGQKMSTQPVE